jgi:hypothetical protein
MLVEAILFRLYSTIRTFERFLIPVLLMGRTVFIFSQHFLASFFLYQPQSLGSFDC